MSAAAGRPPTGWWPSSTTTAVGVIGDPVGQFAQHPQGRLGTLYCDGWQAAGRVLLLGDAAHAMTTTLGQGATQAVEDAAVTIAVAHAAARDRRLGAVAAWTDAIAAIRVPRIDFVMALSRDATDTLLPGADPIAGTLAKGEAPFLARLAQVYGAPPDLRRIGLRQTR